eukprot:6462563-Amphidinium_carterae.3
MGSVVLDAAGRMSRVGLNERSRLRSLIQLGHMLRLLLMMDMARSMSSLCKTIFLMYPSRRCMMWC